MKLLEAGGCTPASLLIIPNNPISPGTVQPKANPVLLEATPPHLSVLGGNASIAAQFCTRAGATSTPRPPSPTLTRPHSRTLVLPPRPGIAAGVNKHTKRTALLKNARQHFDEKKKI